VVRRINAWSLLRSAVLVYLCALLVFMAAGVALWLLASRSGAIPNIETFISQLFALKNFRFKARQLFLATLAIGMICVFLATLFTVITAVVLNLISGVVGGIEFAVLEEEPLGNGSTGRPRTGFLGLTALAAGPAQAGGGSSPAVGGDMTEERWTPT